MPSGISRIKISSAMNRTLAVTDPDRVFSSVFTTTSLDVRRRHCRGRLWPAADAILTNDARRFSVIMPAQQRKPA